MKFRKLYANEIECRVGSIKANGLSLLLYKDARCDMGILDESQGVGALRWKREHRELKGNIYCGVSIYSDELKDWVTKWDAGAESYTEKVKGEASDSFKRACVNWGIGRELYTAPFIWIKPRDEKEFVKKSERYTTYTKFHVDSIDYDNDQISYLVIKDENGAVRYKFGTSKQMINRNTLNDLIDLKIPLVDLEKWADYYKVSYEETDDIATVCKKFTEEQAQFIISRFNKRG